MASVFKCLKSGNVLLEKNVNGKSTRVSTGKKADARTLGWYKAHSEEEFWKLYYKKYGDDASSCITFEEYSKMIVEITSANRNQFSQQAEKSKQKVLCRTFGDMPLDKILTTHIQAWQNELLKIRSPKTVKEYRSTLNMVFEYALNDELIRKNPLKTVKAPKLIKKKVEFFNKEEREILLKNTEGQLHNLIKFAFFSGLRAGEIAGLKWENIDFEKNKINVCERIRRDNVDVPKGGKIRVIDLLPQAKKALMAQQQKTGLHQYVFLSKNNKPYSTTNAITESIKLICEKFDIEKGGLQKIRRSHNTMLKELGLPIDWILHQMGHEEEEVNKKHYTGEINVDLSILESLG